jgi:WhiB family redox-sensing transcriptional regulator
MTDHNWMDKGACLGLDPDDWFPDNNSHPRTTHDAIRVCRTLCQVRDECLQFALAEGLQFGIFGGMLPDQRKALKNKRKRERYKHTVASRFRTA